MANTVCAILHCTGCTYDPLAPFVRIPPLARLQDVTYEQSDGIINLKLYRSGRCVVTLPAAALLKAWQVVVWGPQTVTGGVEVDPAAELVINVLEVEVCNAPAPLNHSTTAQAKLVGTTEISRSSGTC